MDSCTKQMFRLKVRGQGMTMLWWREQLGQRPGPRESWTCGKGQVTEKSRALELQAWGMVQVNDEEETVGCGHLIEPLDYIL